MSAPYKINSIISVIFKRRPSRHVYQIHAMPIFIRNYYDFTFNIFNVETKKKLVVISSLQSVTMLILKTGLWILKTQEVHCYTFKNVIIYKSIRKRTNISNGLLRRLKKIRCLTAEWGDAQVREMLDRLRHRMDGATQLNLIFIRSDHDVPSFTSRKTVQNTCMSKKKKFKGK